MTSIALPDDYNPDFQHEQLNLDPEAFKVLQSLAKAGVVTPTALVLESDLKFEEADLIATYFGEMSRRLQWWIGDLLIKAEELYGEQFAQLAASTGLSEQALLRRMYVCRSVPPQRRRPGLPFSVHLVVASLPAREQNRWLKKAEEGGWSAQELRSRMKAARKDEKPPLFDDEPGDVDAGMLAEVARAILRDAVPHIDSQHHLVPNEDMARLKAALGEEDA